MGIVDNLLSRLDKVKRTGKETWQACCPAHADRHPSLSIRETSDGRVLAHCFAGCAVEDVLSAIGLSFSDLYPPRPLTTYTKPERRPFPAADVLRAIAFEAMVVASAAVAMCSGRTFTNGDRERLIVAVSRIQTALTAAGVADHG